MGVSDTLGEVSDLAESRNYCMLEQNFLLRVVCSFRADNHRVSRVSREVSSVRALFVFVRQKTFQSWFPYISDSPHSVSNDGSAAPGQHKY